MLKVGITGGIGSGKTTVCKIFESLGVPVYYADDRAKWLTENDPDIVAAIKSLFTDDIFKDGRLDRKKVSSIVFSDKNKLQQLNAIIHPAVFKDAEHWQKEQSEKNIPYSLKEAALLFESGSYKELDKIILVSAPLQLRIERVMQRDSTSEEEVLNRINHQMPENEKGKMADFIINNVELEETKKSVLQLHKKLLELSKVY
jgi:dephospho-CoA kinase